MEAIKKVDNYKRVGIPVEMQKRLGWKIGDQIKVEIQDNKIIMTKVENDSEDNLVTQENNSNETLIEPRLPTLSDINKIHKSKYDEPKIKLLDDEPKELNEPLNNLKCSQCGHKIGESRFILNHSYICRNCRNKIRDRLIADIKKRKALRKE